MLLVAGVVFYLGVARPDSDRSLGAKAVANAPSSSEFGISAVARAELATGSPVVEVQLAGLIQEADSTRVSNAAVDDARGMRDPEPENGVLRHDGQNSAAGPLDANPESSVRSAVETRSNPATEIGEFEKGLRHGLWEVRWPDGSLRSKGNYEHGRRSGGWEEYSPGGALVEVLQFMDGERHGPWRRWSDDGQLLGEGDFESNSRAGEWAVYYGDGRIRERGVYRDGLRVGTWEFFDDLGRPTPRTGLYVAGIRVD